MLQAIQRNGSLLVGLIASGWLCVLAAPFLVSPRGALGPTILQSESPIIALIMTVLCMLGATVVALLVTSVLNAAVGLFVLGAGLFALAGRLETVRELAFGATGDTQQIVMWVGFESLLLALVSLLCALAVFAFGGPLKDIQPDEQGKLHDPLFSAAALKSAAAGALCLPVVWIVAQSPMKGQMIGAVFFGGVIVGLAGRLVSPHVQPILLFASPMAFGALGQLASTIMLNRPLDDAYISGTIPNLLLPMPLDYAAGSLTGVAVGVGWAKSFLHHDETPSPAKA